MSDQFPAPGQNEAAIRTQLANSMKKEGKQ
jgi:hypothetical protein